MSQLIGHHHSKYNFDVIFVKLQNNQRYYKVKWVKVCWVGENELSYMGNAVDSFWAQYTQYVQENILFEPSLDDATTVSVYIIQRMLYKCVVHVIYTCI